MLQFIDAKYTYDTNLPLDIEPIVEKYDSAYTINKYGDYILHTDAEYFIVPRHCLVPDCYNYEKYNQDKKLDFSKLKVGESIRIKWVDVTNLAVWSEPVCSQMYTEGILLQNDISFLIIQNPETIRLSPRPIKNHPEQRPTYYVIPKCMVMSIL